jgi:adenylyl-sulfate kinase
MSEHARGFVVWFTGLSGAGKSTLSVPVASRLRDAGYRVEILDGDEVRTHLSKGLGFSKEDRDTNIRRIGYVAELLARNGVVAITAAISPYREIRDEVRAKVTRHRAAFVEVYVECPIDVLAARDPKGLYKKALAGEIQHFTGVSDPYEPPLEAEVTVRSDHERIDDSVEKIVAALKAQGLVRSPV